VADAVEKCECVGWMKIPDRRSEEEGNAAMGERGDCRGELDGVGEVGDNGTDQHIGVFPFHVAGDASQLLGGHVDGNVRGGAELGEE
jgi:hypothetical protein